MWWKCHDIAIAGWFDVVAIVGYIKVRQLDRFLSPSAHVLLSFCVE